MYVTWSYLGKLYLAHLNPIGQVTFLGELDFVDSYATSGVELVVLHKSLVLVFSAGDSTAIAFAASVPEGGPPSTDPQDWQSFGEKKYLVSPEQGYARGLSAVALSGLPGTNARREFLFVAGATTTEEGTIKVVQFDSDFELVRAEVMPPSSPRAKPDSKPGLVVLKARCSNWGNRLYVAWTLARTKLAYVSVLNRWSDDTSVKLRTWFTWPFEVGEARDAGMSFCKGVPVDEAQIRYVHLDLEGRITERVTLGRY